MELPLEKTRKQIQHKGEIWRKVMNIYKHFWQVA